MLNAKSTFVFLLSLAACGTAPPPERGDEALVAIDEAPLQSAGWKIDRRVTSQVGVFLGRNGAAAKAAATQYSKTLPPLTLPAGALTDNAVPLFDVRGDDLAQIDFFVLREASAAKLSLVEVFDANAQRIGLPSDVERIVRGSLLGRAPILKEIRLRGPNDPELAPALSELSKNPFVVFDSVAYVSIFIKKTGSASALEAFRTSIAGGDYEVGDVAPLPNIPHPEQAGIALTALMTVRQTDPLHGKRFVLEVIETN